jgi:lactobin A/cerein 7B family class IIb bacteriocin
MNKNLESFGVQELNAKEVRETEGGLIPLLIIGIALLASSCAPGCAAAKAVYER